MSSCLFTNGRIRTLADSDCDWVLVEGETISATGEKDAPSADRTIDLDGALLLPSFCDAHVHLATTGLFETGMDFRGIESARQILDAFADRARSETGILFGGNFEDPLDAPLTRAELDRAVGPRSALLARADMHSSVVSSALLRRLDVEKLPGVDRDEDGHPTGYLREQASAEAWALFDANLPLEQQREAIHAAARRAYSKGVTEVHEMFVTEWRGWESFDTLVETLEDEPLGVVPYVATDDVARVAGMGLARIGGDYFLDGSFGSHTAWLSSPYSSPPPPGSGPTGIAYRSDAELLRFFNDAQAAGLQVGVHAIGDAAVEQAIRTWELVAASLGTEEVRRIGHRIEHFECASDDHMARAVLLGLRASVQPAFDHFWGGPDGMYAQRIGWDRASAMNRFRSMMDSGLVLGAGSDSTVTPLDPFLQIASLRSHHVESESLSAEEAIRLHTSGARALADGRGGAIAVEQPADVVAVDRDPLESPPAELSGTRVLGTWIKGRRVWPPGEADEEFA
jgi:predicted amidohydrolase YtcJ